MASGMTVSCVISIIGLLIRSCSVQISYKLMKSAIVFALIVMILTFTTTMVTFAAPIAEEPQPAPDFVLPGLLDTNTYSLKDLKGKVVLLNIWASWCTGCREEMEGLMLVQEQYGPQGFVIMAVNIDNAASKATDFMKGLEVKTGKKTGFILLYDKDKTVPRDYHQRAMPTSYLIDREGRLKKIYPGSFTKSRLGALKAAIEEAFK
jgi:cytochrome c biogenesis protein CcmG/thiol:disulfide interchange protein DsbE